MAGQSSILVSMLALPAAGGLAVFLMPVKYAKSARGVAMALLGATFILSVFAASWMEWRDGGTVQLEAKAHWIRAIGFEWHTGADALSITMVLLTTGMGMVACWASFGVSRMPRSYFALLLWLVASTLGVFLAQNLLLFFVFFELSVIPVYLLVGGWGGGRKEYAASKYLLFSLIAGVAFLVAVVLIQKMAGTTELSRVGALSGPGVRALFWTVMGVMGMRMAAVPLHTWLGDVVAEAATPVGMVVVAVGTKVGAYGIVKLGWGLFGAQAAADSAVLAWLGAVSIVYGALAALAQRDVRRVVAFGSISGMGFVLLGIASGNSTALLGAVFTLVAHGVWSAMLVFVTGMIADRTGHCDIQRLGGLGGHMPSFAGWAAVAFLTAMGIPGLCGFVGELLVVMGVFGSGSADAALWGMSAAVALVLTGACFLWTYQRVFMGAPKPEHSNVARLSRTEKWILAFFAGASVILGVVPGVVLEGVRGWVESVGR